MSGTRLRSLLVPVALVATACIAAAQTPVNASTGAPRAIPSGNSRTSVLNTAGSTDQGITFASIPRRIGAGAAVRAITAIKKNLTVSYVSQTPNVCQGAGRYILTVSPGRCRVHVLVSDRVVRRISIDVTYEGVTADDEVVNAETLLFNPDASKITKVAKAQMAQFASLAKGSKAVAVMGFAANDGGKLGSGFARYLSMRRAQKVAEYLENLGIRVSTVSWHGNLVPVSQRNLRLNRRVVVAWVSS